MSTAPTSASTVTQFSSTTFHADVEFLEARWQRLPVGQIDLPLIDLGVGSPLMFVPIHEHLDFAYARQIQTFSQSRRVLLYRRHESRTHFVGSHERVEELRQVLDALDISSADFVAHGDGAMVLFEFALCYPQRCRSLVIVAQGANYRIPPHPLIWLLHELSLRLPIPVERLMPASLLLRTVLRYVIHTAPVSSQEMLSSLHELPRSLIEEQFRKIMNWPALYRYSVVPVIHNFDIRTRLDKLTMPILLINRLDDPLSPQAETSWLAQHLPNCAGYHLIPGRGRFFLYSEAERVTPLIATFLSNLPQNEAAEQHITE